MYKLGGFFQRADYLTQPNREKSKIIFNFKMGNHTLPVERLRYGNIPRHQRYCTNFACRGQHILGDESHIFRCPKNKFVLIATWKFLQTDPRIDINSQNEICRLIDASERGQYWNAAWMREWEMILDLCMKLCLTLCTKTIVQILQKYWQPFKHIYCS